MKSWIFIVLSAITIVHRTRAQCQGHQSLTFTRWAAVSPETFNPVFVYSASGEETSLTEACLARCRELDECAAVIVVYGKGSCHGITRTGDENLKNDNDAAYFKKICLDLPESCEQRWWAVEVTPGYLLHSDASKMTVINNTTLENCFSEMYSGTVNHVYRSAQWMGKDNLAHELLPTSESTLGHCVLKDEDKYIEPESYRVSNYYTFYIENQCRHDYQKKIERCSYEEYYNQTLKHVEATMKNYSKDECKAACEMEGHFVCRGFSWTPRDRTGRGLCDLHSEDLVTTGSWLLRRTTGSTYYRRVICLNITVECEDSFLVVTYRPRGLFRGRLYVPGRGEQCSARAAGYGSPVRLALPMHGDCDVNFAYAITNGPNGVINRTMAYVMVMIQNNPVIQTAGDRWVRVGCSPGQRAVTQVDTTVAVRDNGKPSLPSESTVEPPAAASAVYNSNSAPLTMYVVRDEDATGAVSLGELLELRIETTDEAEIEAYHLVASSRLGDSSVLLLDSKGCPTGQVDFPPFTRTMIGGTQQLSAKFKAFRFPTSHIVRFALMVRFCDKKCAPMKCDINQARNVREANDTLQDWLDDSVIAAVLEDAPEGRGVVAQGGRAECGGGGRVPLELEMVVGAKDILSADTLIRADHRDTDEELTSTSSSLVCVHELLIVALVLAWLAVQILLLVGCCVLVNRYRNLAELNMQKDYQSFDNVGFDSVSTHRRVHWPDQNIDVLHGT